MKAASVFSVDNRQFHTVALVQELNKGKMFEGWQEDR